MCTIVLFLLLFWETLYDSAQRHTLKEGKVQENLFLLIALIGTSCLLQLCGLLQE
jgi:hypothetical protein